MAFISSMNLSKESRMLCLLWTLEMIPPASMPVCRV